MTIIPKLWPPDTHPKKKPLLLYPDLIDNVKFTDNGMRVVDPPGTFPAIDSYIAIRKDQE